MRGRPDATVVVTTKDRRDELAGLLPTVLAQSVPLDVLVLDDGSGDGTAELVRREFPSVRVDRVERNLGLIAQRNRAAHLVDTPIIVSLDDDARLPSRDSVAQTLADFEHPRIAAVAMPYVDVRRGPEVKQAAPDGDGVWVTDTFIGTAHAIRRDLFLAAGGYRVELGRGVEEPELSLRLLAFGTVVRLGRADPVHHLESPRRAGALNERLIWRNNWRAAWWDVPWPYLAVRAAKLALTTPAVGARVGRPWSTARGMLDGLRLAPSDLRGRRPVSRAVYRVNHDLRRRGPLPLADVVPRLPPAPSATAAPGAPPTVQ
jgi:glycosyltransferase involved in cell wall biosynthesis